ncbi:hypothetical protein, partial [Glycomyces tenuis]|uniref:hypothetical protein n=1 Tax=Glycomyces tenuis TaxID=58116 RepID=UPI00200B06D1
MRGVADQDHPALRPPRQARQVLELVRRGEVLRCHAVEDRRRRAVVAREGEAQAPHPGLDVGLPQLVTIDAPDREVGEPTAFVPFDLVSEEGRAAEHEVLGAAGVWQAVALDVAAEADQAGVARLGRLGVDAGAHGRVDA